MPDARSWMSQKTAAIMQAQIKQYEADSKAYYAKYPKKPSWKNVFQPSVNYVQPTNNYPGQNYSGQNLKGVNGSSKLQAAAAPVTSYKFRSGKTRVKDFSK